MVTWHDLGFGVLALASLFVLATGVVWMSEDWGPGGNSEGLAAVVLGGVLLAWACVEVVG